MAESFFIFYALSVVVVGGDFLGGGEFLGGGVILGGGDVLGARDYLEGGVIFYFLCFISRCGWRSHFGGRGDILVGGGLFGWRSHFGWRRCLGWRSRF